MSKQTLAMTQTTVMAESYMRSIEILHRPPEFELTEAEKAEVEAFEQALCNAKFPAGFEFLENRIEQPPKNIAEIVKEKNDVKTFGVGWFVQTSKGMQCLSDMGFSGDITTENVKSFLAKNVPIIHAKNTKIKDPKKKLDDGYEDSRVWARQQLEAKLKDEIEKGSSDIAEPEYFTILRKPEVVVEKVAVARELKKYYKAIEAGLRSQELTPVADAKLVMLTRHRLRLNTLIAANYRNAIPLLQQYRLAPDVLSSEQVEKLTDSFPVLRTADTNDMDKMARIYSMIDKFITGIDGENGFSQISAEIERLQLELEDTPSEENHTRASYDAERVAETLVDADHLKGLIETVLQSYNLLSAEEYFKRSEGTTSDGLWQVVVSKVRTSLSVDADKRIVWIPNSFSRTLDQKKPTGVLPLIDHEMTHVLQIMNAEKLGIKLLQIDRSARGSLWFETGATEQEDKAFKKHFGIERGTNFHYLRAMQAQLAGGSITECAKVFYDSLTKSGDTPDQDEAILTAVDRTLRLFKNGTEWAPGTGYLTNTEPLEYAEQEVLRRNMPADLHWLYFVGKLNFESLAELHRIGWLNKEDIFIPQRMPADIALEQIIVSHTK